MVLERSGSAERFRRREARFGVRNRNDFVVALRLGARGEVLERSGSAERFRSERGKSKRIHPPLVLFRRRAQRHNRSRAGQGEIKTRPMINRRLRPDAPAVPLHDALRQRETGTDALVVHGVVLALRLFCLSHWNSGIVIQRATIIRWQVSRMQAGCESVVKRM